MPKGKAIARATRDTYEQHECNLDRVNAGVGEFLYSFGNAKAAVIEPYGGLITDNNSNLYATAVGGGNYKRGMVYAASGMKFPLP